MKTYRVRAIYQKTGAPEVQLSDDEAIVGADHEGGDWWIYVAQRKDDDERSASRGTA